MKRILYYWFALLALLPALHGAAKTEISLLLSHDTARPGDTITAVLRMVSEPDWHTYWRNPGDAGMAAAIDWQLPPGLAAGPIEWPVPAKKTISKLHAYVYDHEVLLLIPLKIGAEAASGTFLLKGAVSWLECSEKTCVPQEGTVEATLQIGGQSAESAHTATVARARARLPKSPAPFAVTATWETAAQPDTRALVLAWNSASAAGEAKPEFFPFESELYSMLGPTEVLQTGPAVRLKKLVQRSGAEWPATIGGLVLESSGEKSSPAYEVNLPVAALAGAPAGGAATATDANANANANANAAASTGAVAPVELAGGNGSASGSFLALLGFAFLGGLILNIMPCVLPVIALKILGFVNQSREEPGRVRQLGLFYTLGVLASFLVLALAIISAKQAGQDVNWGMQMQNPYFVVGMTALVTLVALNLWGVFEITVSGRALGAASNLASREGIGGAFYNGVLATLLATPCTAPALAFAVGSVLTQPSYRILLTFLTIGLGLALPYLLLSWNPRWLKLLPKPGAWMEKFKMAMGFPMAATAIWLLSVAAKHFGKPGTLWLGMFLVFVGLAAWIFGEFFQRSSRYRLAGLVTALAVLAGGYLFALEKKLDWRNPAQETGDTELATRPDGIPWQKWTPEAVTQARAAGHPVLVDFTADWCLTCQVNKESSLEIESVRAKLKALGAVPFLADFTRRNTQIAQEIRRFNRAGVPLVIVYPAEASAAPIVLPEILTPGIVLNALEMAARSQPTSAYPATRTLSAALAP